MSNLTNPGISATIYEVVCAPSLHGDHFIQTLAAINVLFAVSASIGNAVILIALHKESTLHSSSKFLFQNLAVTDLCVGVFIQPLYATQLISSTNEQAKLCYTVSSIAEIAGKSLTGVSLLTLTAISADRLFALRLGVRYKGTITLRRTRIVVACIWILVISINSFRTFLSYFLTARLISAVIYSSLAISALCYLTIYVTLRHHRNAMQDNVQQGQSNRGLGVKSPLNIGRYRKTVSTALYVQLALIICYLPYGVVMAWVLANGYFSSFKLTLYLTGTPVLLNSSLNPILYFWKIASVRQAVKEIMTQLCSCLSSN